MPPARPPHPIAAAPARGPHPPPFIVDGGFNWSARGYHYTLPDEQRAQLISRRWPDDPYQFLARVVELAKTGDRSEVASLSSLFHASNDTNIAPAALLVTGDMGGRSELAQLIDVMRHGPDPLRVYACQAARNAGSLWLVPHMLAAWNHCSGADRHQQIGLTIADLLDPIATLDETGPVGAHAGMYTYAPDPSLADTRLAALALKLRDTAAGQAFNNLVTDKHAQLLAACDSEDDAIWAGERAGAVELARHFLRMISPPAFHSTQSPLTATLREKFEATTGIDCSGFFRAGQFVQSEAIHTLKTFLASPNATHFKPGARHFFAHPIT